MANKTFYIHEDVEENLEREQNKGGLINDILREHYSLLGKNTRYSDKDLPQLQKNKNIKVNKDGTISPKKLGVETLLTSVPGLIPASQIKRPDNGTCKKHGTPLTDNGKCLQKGH